MHEAALRAFVHNRMIETVSYVVMENIGLLVQNAIFVSNYSWKASNRVKEKEYSVGLRRKIRDFSPSLPGLDFSYDNDIPSNEKEI